MFLGSDHRYVVLAHQTIDSAVADFKPQLFQFLCHSWPAIAAQRQAMLLSDMGQQQHILTLALAERGIDV
jgi:flagellar motor switch protein FliG